MKRMLLMAACALLLSACASTTTRDGMVYRDGSWYSPASEGHGDYYTAARHDHDVGYYNWPWAWSVGFVPYGGYCPAMYRYCTSFWADPFYGPGYYPWGYRPWVYYQRPHHRDRHHDDSVAEQEPRPRPRLVRDPGGERGSPSPRLGGPGLGSGRADGGEGRPRRRSGGGRRGSE